jgi:hypothetical protein
VSRLIDEPITVHIKESDCPAAFIWRRRLYRVMSVLCCWREPAAWWRSQPVSLVFRISARRGVTGIYELARRGADWFLHRIVD